MDFMECLAQEVNKTDLPVKCKLGYLGEGESFVLYPLPGGRKIREYYDGSSDQQLNFEFAMKSHSQQKLNATLWQVSDYLESIQMITSQTNSFTFDSLEVTNKPFINNYDEQGWFVFILDITAKITVFKEEKG